MMNIMRNTEDWNQSLNKTSLCARQFRNLSKIDGWITCADQAIRSIWAAPPMTRTYPPLCANTSSAEKLSQNERAEAGNLMRINHAGEICAQALYSAQGFLSTNQECRNFMQKARLEEIEHLAWTQQRLQELGARKSMLNPIWYFGAFTVGIIAGSMGENVSLGFVTETEKQVENHLISNLERIPTNDHYSKAIVQQMIKDENTHGNKAMKLGGKDISILFKLSMKLAGKIMTITSYRL